MSRRGVDRQTWSPLISTEHTVFVAAMPTNWNDIKVIEGVLVAYLASNNNKIDLREVARLYGNGMTYDALEYHFRPWKTQAKDLKAAAVNDTVATPKKPPDKVQAGRVSKNKLS
ncbi:hypothetical protein COCHEDRAFT_19022 [Bipolaris maydis C5]|uniref:Uncharacterized protein n=1 Tax=Cochliobolus heterostrophus (strain C5 / ATCC 48332 / race O) TaxID=701091 RepID=M2UXY7_COCH5|nr:hypothetical protein COCHEDRAFT_19022 [Bipolaris maydis C5]